MKNVLIAPRVRIPRKDFETWAVPAPERMAYAARGTFSPADPDAPSAARFFPPEGDPEEAASAVAESMYFALEDEWTEKLARGPILVERTLKGGVRYGIVAAIDLDAYSYALFRNGLPAIMPAQEGDTSESDLFYAVRKKAPLEFPHAVVFYRDKKQKIIPRLLEEEFEELYDFVLPGSGRVRGFFIPDPFASWALDEMHTRGEPAFAVADGIEEINAAKRHWEAIKPFLDRAELSSHPARFALVELENIFEEGVEIFPVHRLVEETDAEALLDFFSRKVKCKREGSVLIPDLKGAEAAATCDGILEDYLRQNGGKIGYVCGASELKARAAAEDTVGILLNTIEKEDILSALKSGKPLPRHTFTVGRALEGRYLLEGREIGYD